jgi:hypothetical protein
MKSGKKIKFHDFLIQKAVWYAHPKNKNSCSMSYADNHYKLILVKIVMKKKSLYDFCVLHFISYHSNKLDSSPVNKNPMKSEPCGTPSHHVKILLCTFMFRLENSPFFRLSLFIFHFLQILSHICNSLVENHDNFALLFEAVSLFNVSGEFSE